MLDIATCVFSPHKPIVCDMAVLCVLAVLVDLPEAHDLYIR